MGSSRTILSFALVGVLIGASGCASFWHDLKPHRLQRMNRGPAPSADPEFSFRRSDSRTKLAHKNSSSKAATLSVNSAEEISVRAQSH